MKIVSAINHPNHTTRIIANVSFPRPDPTPCRPSSSPGCAAAAAALAALVLVQAVDTSGKPLGPWLQPPPPLPRPTRSPAFNLRTQPSTAYPKRRLFSKCAFTLDEHIPLINGLKSLIWRRLFLASANTRF